jgi:methionyl-tRNA formyltransferase
MRVVFLGTPEFAVPALQQLLDNSYEICAVFTQPDRPSGRGQKLQSSLVKTLALARGIPVYQPERIRLEENRRVFEDLRPDFIVVVAYGQILPVWLLQSARYVPVNIHASLLPRYRGAAPINWAIIRGETVTGVTTMVMQEKLDTGPVLMQQEVSIPPTMTAGGLSKQLSAAGAGLLVRTLEAFQRDAINPVVQDESLVSWAPRITKEMALVSWEKNAVDLHNQIRGMNPWPCAYADFRGGRLHIWQSLPESSSSKTTPGTILGFAGEGIQVQCGGGTVLSLLEMQMPGKSRISGRQFVNGARLHAGDKIT